MSKLLPWTQELLWVQRNEAGVLIKTSEKPPQTDDFIPYIPLTKK
jgi:hypothetical protein